MRIFDTKQKVKITKAEIEKARDFAQKVISTVNYFDSNQRVLKKIQDDHFISKIGEEAVRKVFEHFGKTVVGPDYKIYEGRAKSWDEDLYIDKVGFAVKTQKWSAAEKYGLSWTFQHSEARKDPILRNPESWVCFVLVKDIDGSFDSYVFPVKRVKELVFGEPKLAHLRGKKKVVYFGELKKS